ncbi:DUF5381 family protein [Cytobacillus firmus]|uniref:DUF5381 family protein n=1 Tax=Cytobacillus firmus TaxID=1399 RepID=UPI00077CA32E|nr:DUF5381 family protein [Cytobacillus firmus]MBG9543649.1 hypothetical protein [Cytobacillus firmus]MBG9545854.1 hypothetical protein [Cytobacillus firmus]MBG9551826.1 hypothetical protein [Cytobacillus firmus]MBG9556114.1 hypothetical protein [Cytobacillus firmus]MBG9575630.1 hypothetical protein [Cytobacillus firmus]
MIQNKGDTVIIKGSKFMYVWMFLATVGFLIACIFLIIHGLKFNSKYSFLYLGGGIVFTPFYLYLTIWSLPGFMPGKVLLKIVPGDKGTVTAPKATVLIKNIRNIDLIRNPLNLINDIVIETLDDQKIKIRTYNLLDDGDFQVIVDQYIFPYMNDNARKVWDRKIDLDKLREEDNYVRQEHRIE